MFLWAGHTQRETGDLPISRLRKILTGFLAAFVIFGVCFAGWRAYLQLGKSGIQNSVVSQNKDGAVARLAPQVASSAPTKNVPAQPNEKPGTREERIPVRAQGTIHGNDNTVVGRVPYRAVNGNGNTIVGATDANGNTIFNHGGTAIGSGAQAGPTGVAIGAHANAGALGSRQTQTTNNAPNGIAISGGNVVNPTVNNYAAPQRQIPKQIQDELIAALKEYPGEVHLNSDSGDFEANTLARQFFSIFEAAGWHPIEIGTLMGGSALPQEIRIGYCGTAGIPGQMGSIPDDQPAARAVAQALFRSGFKRITITPNPNDKANVLSINIGHNAEMLVPQ